MNMNYSHPYNIFENNFNAMNFGQSFSPQQLNAYQNFQRNLLIQQALLLRNSANVNLLNTSTNEFCSGSTYVNNDYQKVFADRQKSYMDMYMETKQSELSNPLNQKNEYFGEHFYQNFEGKVEEKCEETSEQKVESLDDSFEEKQDPYGDDDQRTRSSPESCNLNFSGEPKNLKVQLKEMIMFIIEHHGQIRDADLKKERIKYTHDPTLVQVFDILYSKYSCTFKTRAEIVKYITRKAFSTIKNNSKRAVDSSAKESCDVLCNRYFQTSSKDIQSSGLDIEKRERFLQLLFPYQKNSKNKLQGMELISKLMASKEFYEDYCIYVKNLDSILDADNSRKMPKFISFILSCIKRNQIDNIMKYKRVPWLKAWIGNTKSLAKELAFSIQWKNQQTPSKQQKMEKTNSKKVLEVSMF